MSNTKELRKKATPLVRAKLNSVFMVLSKMALCIFDKVFIYQHCSNDICWFQAMRLEPAERILFCDNVMKFSDSYVDGCDNYFRKRK